MLDSTAPLAGDVLKFLQLGIIRCELDGAVTAINALALEHLGLAPHDEPRACSAKLQELVSFDMPGVAPIERFQMTRGYRAFPCSIRMHDGSWKRLLFDGFGDPTSSAACVLVVRPDSVEHNAENNPYRSIFDAIDDSVVVHEVETGAIIDANRAAQAWAGYVGKPTGEVRPSDVSLMPPDQAEAIAAGYLQKAIAGEPQVFEWLARQRDGSSLWLEVSLKRASLAGTDRLVASMRDITSRKRTEKALRESEELHRLIVTSTHEIVYMLDARGCFTFINVRGEEATGHRADDWVGLSFEPLVFPEDLELARSVFLRVMDGEHVRYRVRVYDASGRIRQMLISCAPLLRDDQIVGLVGLGTDVSDLIEAQDALVREKEQLAVTLESIADAVVTTNVEAQVVMMNRVAQNLTSWSQAQAKGRHLSDVMSLASEHSEQSMLDALLAASEPTQSEAPMLLTTRDGRTVLVEASVSPIRAPSGMVTGLVLVLRDITAHRRLEEQLHRTQKLESLGLLAGGIAHDFNNLLTVIMGGLAIARRSLQAPGLVDDVLLGGEKACMRAKDLTQQLLTFSRGGAPIKKAGSIDALIQETARFALRGGRVVAKLELPSDLWLVDMDAGQMSQVLNNLMLNAMQAMPKGGTVTVRAANAALDDSAAERLRLKPGPYVQVEVQDEGVGIPPEHRERIFDPYFTTKPCGIGLGLATSYSIVHKHGGHIDLQSAVGGGTTFVLLLPAAPNEHLRLESVSVERPLLCHGRVLVMDDEETVRQIACRMLQLIGYETDSCADGASAVQLYEHAHQQGRGYDAVILDLTVPGGVSGKDAVRDIRRRFPDAVVIASSGYSTDPVMADHRAFGFDATIPKPYLPQDLEVVMQSLLRGIDKN